MQQEHLHKVKNKQKKKISMWQYPNNNKKTEKENAKKRRK